MSDVSDMINIILSDDKLKNSKAFGSDIYRDEPIIRPASRLANCVPQEIREMRKMETFREYDSCEYMFYRQGKKMENFEDNFDYRGEFFRYYPTYQVMDTNQLRGYFSWRTKIRHGEFLPVSLSFAYVYVYELLNGIGVTDASDGYEKLMSFRLWYGEFAPQINRNLNRWIYDYVIYNNLDKALLDGLEQNEYDNSLMILLDLQNRGKDEIFSAISQLCAYEIAKSKFFSQHPEESAEIIVKVFVALTEYYSSHGKKEFIERLFSRRISCAYQMFNLAVFYDTRRYEDFTYKVNDINVFTCKNGTWFNESYQVARGKSAQLGAIVRAIDSIMREKYGFQYKLSYELKEKTIPKIITETVGKTVEKKRKAELPVIEIDISKLGGIRRAADITRERLIVDESVENDIEPIGEATDFPTENQSASGKSENETPQTVSETASGCAVLLTEDETEFVKCLLYGKPYASLISEKHLMLSVVCDSINEKMFDEFGDTVIGFDGENPTVIEDYADELKGMIAE